MPGMQQIEEVQPALALPGAEPREIVVADLCAETVGVPMPRSGVVNSDPAGDLQTGVQHRAALGQEAVLGCGVN